MRDAIVIGGGPAGATSAALLARHGHRVTLVTRAVPPAPWLAESVPASARKLLDRVGALEAVEGAGFLPNEGNTVWWAGRPEHSERFPADEPGFHADRAGLETAMLGLARSAGVHILQGTPVREVGRDSEVWSVETGAETIRSRWLLDASGRGGVFARRDLRLKEAQTSTLALVGRWVCDGGSDAEPGHTLIESYEDGWAWSVPLSRTERCVTAMVDPRRTALARKHGLDGMLASEMEKATRLSDRLGDGRSAGKTRACPASLYGASQYAVPGALLVGDAGSFIDPLSSYGVKKALSSAWLASIVVHTALMEDEMLHAALEFYDRQEKEVYRTYRARSIPFFDDAVDAHGHPFWEVRAEAARRATGSTVAKEAPGQDPSDPVSLDSEAEAFVGDPRVRRAFEEIRDRAELGVRAGTTLSTVDRPAVVGDRIALDPHLTSDALPGGTRFVRNIDLRRLVRLAPGFDQVPDLYEAYNRDGSTADLGEFLAALGLAVGAGFLEFERSSV